MRPLVPLEDPTRTSPTPEAFATHLGTRFRCTCFVRGAELLDTGAAPLEELASAAVLWSDPLGQLLVPGSDLETLRDAAATAPVTLVAGGAGVSPLSLEKALLTAGLPTAFRGWLANDAGAKSIPAVVVSSAAAPRDASPAEFRVVALVCVYNEADLVAAALEKLSTEGVEILVLDNWSTDGTWEIARSLLGRGVLDVRRFPASGPSDTFSLSALLTEKERLVRELDADWFLHTDIDEVRRSAWPGVTLREGLFLVSRGGYDAVDFTVVVHPAVDEAFVAGMDHERHFRHFAFSSPFWDFLRVNAFRPAGRDVCLTSSGGHEAIFEGRRVFPFKFLMRHYPIRGQAHGERKIFRERIGRWDPAETARGWHIQYDGLTHGQSLLADPSGLRLFDDTSFLEEFLAERLTGLGALAAKTPEGSDLTRAVPRAEALDDEREEDRVTKPTE
jgi:hypothetical protein